MSEGIERVGDRLLRHDAERTVRSVERGARLRDRIVRADDHYRDPVGLRIPEAEDVGRREDRAEKARADEGDHDDARAH